MRRFVVVGQRAKGPPFSLDDLPSTSGRLDALLACLRAALLVSHGVREDTVLYLVLEGAPAAPCVLRFDGATARFLRPDERALAVLVKKSLEAPRGPTLSTVRPGVAVADGGLPLVLADLGAHTPYVLDERGEDVRAAALAEDAVFFVGDHVGLSSDVQAMADAGARRLRVGPVSLHAGDAIVLLANELDRRAG